MMRTCLQPRRATRAFTLLELLLATAVGAVVLLVINTTFFSALRLHNTTHQKIEEDLELQRALIIVRRDLAGIRVPGNPQSTAYTLAGQLQTEVFATTGLDIIATRISPDIHTTSARIDGWTPFSETQVVSYFLAPATDGSSDKDLVRLVTRNVLSASTQEEGIAQTLLTGVRAAELYYYDGSGWVGMWDSATSQTLPTAIKFSLVRAPREANTARMDPDPVEIIVPVMVTTQTSAQQAAQAATGQ